MNTSRSLPPEPPARGSFPLDHGGECKLAMAAFTGCVQAHGNLHHQCRDESKAYLQCRMDRGLMAKEDLTTLGFNDSFPVKMDSSATAAEPGEVVAGLAAAAKKKGFMFGLGSGAPAQRGGGH